jgi:hypothetical protein
MINLLIFCAIAWLITTFFSAIGLPSLGIAIVLLLGVFAINAQYDRSPKPPVRM